MPDGRLPFLTEDDVIDAIELHLTGNGWEIVSRARATQTGYDLVVTRGRTRMIVEAKGAGSSKVHSAGYGKVFNPKQVRAHVANAVLKALRVVSADGARAAIALPDNADHRREVEQVTPALRQLGVGVFWVGDDSAVKLDAAWKL